MALTTQKLNDVSQDIDHITAFATSQATNVVDRLGNSKPSLAGVVAHVDARVDQVTADARASRDAAGASAAQAVGSATLANNYAAAGATAAKYGDTIALGRALVADGQTFGVRPNATDGISRPRLYRREAAGGQTLLLDQVSALEVDDIYVERFFAAQSRFFAERRLHNRDVANDQALIICYLGQSNGTGGVNASTLSGTPSLDAYTFTAGPYLGYYQFYSGNIEYPLNWADVAAARQYTEGVSEGPCGGMIAGLAGLYRRMYVFSAALGGMPLLKLMGSGERCNLYAMLHRACDLARAAGFEPIVVASSVHGEANMGGYSDMSEADYYTYGLEYYRDFQKAAAQAMQRPEYRAPIVFHNPAQNGTPECWKIHRAIVRVASETQNAILSSSINQWEMDGDGVHNWSTGYRERGEWDAFLLRRYLQDGVRRASPKLVQAVRNGLNVTLTFDQEVALRTQGGALNLGSALNVGVALNGVEFVDNNGGNYIAITPNSMVFGGRTVTFSIASVPTGAAGTQEVRIGMQQGTQSGWPNSISGSPIAAANDFGEPSIYDPAKRSYHYVVPFSVTVR